MGTGTRRLLAKALAEFAHERLLHPLPEDPAPGPDGTAPVSPSPHDPDPHDAAPVTDPDGTARYAVTCDDGRTTYRFAARRLALDHWEVDPASITRHRAPDERGPDDAGPLDVPGFVTGLRGTLGLSDDVLPVYLEEITATLSAAAFRNRGTAVPTADLVLAGFQAIEAGMTAGHPCFVANSGRLGFGSGDHRRYAPEAAAAVRLSWLAAHRERAAFSAGERWTRPVSWPLSWARARSPASTARSPHRAWTRRTTC